MTALNQPALRMKKKRRRAIDELEREGYVYRVQGAGTFPTGKRFRQGMFRVRPFKEWARHPDHRYTGVLVQDAAYMVTVPFFCPDVPALAQNPAFFYFPDRFQKPNTLSSSFFLPVPRSNGCALQNGVQRCRFIEKPLLSNADHVAG